MNTRTLAVLLVATPLIAACGLVSPSDGDGARGDLETARAQWVAAGIQDYDLTVVRFCYCPEVGPVEVTVRGGATTAVTPVDSTVSEPNLLSGYPDVEGLFAVVDDALRRQAHRLRVVYHPTLGYPTEISVDYREGVADEELGYAASLKVLRDGA